MHRDTNDTIELTIAVANYFIQKSFDEGKRITPLQVMKLTYIAHGLFLGNYGRPLVSETVEAWQYGPVFPSLYQDFKHYGREPITQAKRIGDGVPLPKSQLVRDGLDAVWDAYKAFSGGQLTTLTHTPDTPWHKVWTKEKGAVHRGSPISNDSIQAHYEQKLNEWRAATQ